MSNSKINDDNKYNQYISEIVNSADNVNLLIDKLITLLIKVQDEGKDFDEAKYFIKKYITISSQIIDDVLNWLKENQNEPKYIFLLGFFYHKFSLLENNSEGFVYFLKAAEDSYPIAQVYLSICYNKGFGTEISDNLAFNWIQKAAENESIIGQNILGCYYKDGIGIDKDLIKVFYWYQKAAENGHETAKNNLVSLYCSGEGTEKNLEKAFYWYQNAAENGQEGAMYKLAQFYKNGKEIE